MVSAIMFLNWIAAQVATKILDLSSRQKNVLMVSKWYYQVLCAYPLFVLQVLFFWDLPSYQKWSQLWDYRDREIKESSQSGNRDVEVMELEHIIPNI